MAQQRVTFAALLKEEKDVCSSFWRSPSNLELALMDLDNLAVWDKPKALSLLDELATRVNDAYTEVFGHAFDPVAPIKRGKTLREAHLPRLAQLCYFASRRFALSE